MIHRYYVGGNWGPSWEEAGDLGGDVEALPSASWGDNRLDIVGKPATGRISTRRGPDTTGFRMARSGDNASLRHKYHQDGWSAWEDLGEGHLLAIHVATSWGEGRLDFWAINSDGELNRIYWDGHRYSDWENLGGGFIDTPKIVHWKPNRIDMVGKGLNDEKFHLKAYDGSQYNPSSAKWYKSVRPFSSELALLAKHDTSKQIFSSRVMDTELMAIHISCIYSAITR
ncbi:putative Fucose-specific lectin [Seiridium cardinale]|uniref:Fucose-specific lectin n=1 Tax=Seiridium cardinale TaxID=138064 RepID=A0ABR2XD16_9PEZI